MWREIEIELQRKFPADVVRDLVTTFDQLVIKHVTGDYEGALTKAGRFVEHALRAIEAVRVGIAPPSVKSVCSKITQLENDSSLDESLRLIVPRALYGMVYNIRSKRNSVHVNETDPTRIDVALCISAASWTLAEFLRISSLMESVSVEQHMLAITRANLPFVEQIAGEVFVGKQLGAKLEVLLLLAHFASKGMTRTEVGKSSKYDPSTVSKALKLLASTSNRYVHLDNTGRYFLTSHGELYLANEVAGLVYAETKR